MDQGQPVPVSLTLRVRDLDGMLGFYHDLLGLPTERREEGATLGWPAAHFLTLEEDPSARRPRTPVVGLYHHALLVPDRGALGAVLRRLLEAEAAFEGFADHGVSEALYLRDPEGNGVEIYRDREPDAWPTDEHGIAMTTRHLDLDALLGGAPQPTPLPEATRLGHLHLHVGSLAEGERFFGEGLGLAITQRSYPGALFLAAGAYHHHVGLNTWAGDTLPPAGSTGLAGHRWQARGGDLDAFAARLDELGYPTEREGDTLRTTDPTRTPVVLEV